jgi:hypothetical protein
VQWPGLIRVSVSTWTAPPLALASLRQLKLRQPKSCARFTQSLQSLPNRNRGVSPMSNKVVCACALVAALSILAQPGVAKDAPPLHQGP